MLMLGAQLRGGFGFEDQAGVGFFEGEVGVVEPCFLEGIGEAQEGALQDSGGSEERLCI